MGPFSIEARSQCNIMQEMFKKMETLYIGLESYYVFDKQKYTLEELAFSLFTLRKYTPSAEVQK